VFPPNLFFAPPNGKRSFAVVEPPNIAVRVVLREPFHLFLLIIVLSALELAEFGKAKSGPTAWQ
jgi:hypothetical protein